MLHENALTAATRPDFTNVFYYLLQQGADVNAPSGIQGDTPLKAAIVWGDQNIDKVRALIDKGADINAKDKYGNTPLSGALANRRATKIAELLKSLGAKDRE